MEKQRSEEKTQPNRIDIIRTVKTPLGFFTLVVLIVEAILGITANFSQGADRTYLVIGMIVLIFLLIIIVAILAALRPEALSGKRPIEVTSKLNGKLSSSERIVKYRELIEREIRDSLLINFNVPAGYKPEISESGKFIFGFCYPEDWAFSKFPEQVRYGAAYDTTSAEKLGFTRNINIVIDNLTDNNIDLSEYYQASLAQVLAFIPNSNLVFKEEDFIFQGLHATRWRIDWKPNIEMKQVVSNYQIVAADKEKKNVYNISFTTTQEDFETSRKLFDNIAATFRIS